MSSLGNKTFALLAGKGDPFGPWHLSSILGRGLQPEAIILDQKEMSRRDQMLIRSRVGGRVFSKCFADYPSVQIFSVANHNSSICLDIVSSLKVDFLVNIGSPRILNDRILGSTDIGIINCHPGLLPKYRGCSCVEWSIFNNDLVGVTVHKMSNSIDEGPIISQQVVEIYPGTTYQQIRKKVYKTSVDLLTSTTYDLAVNRIQPRDFVDQGVGHYFNPMPEYIFDQMLEKIKNKAYRPSTAV